MKWVEIVLLSVVCITFSCKQSRFKKNKTHAQVSELSIERGEALAKIYCQSCHLLPDPSLLSAAKWEKGVLPQMGPRLGIFNYDLQSYPLRIKDPNIGPSFYPEKQMIGFADWQNIIDYYTSTAPDSLISSADDVFISPSTALFTPVQPGSFFSYPHPMTGCLYADTSGKTMNLFVADTQKKNVVQTSQDLTPVDSIMFDSPVVNMWLRHDTLLTTNIGILNPNDKQTGSIQQVILHHGIITSHVPVVLADSLRRPVHMDVSDLNGDGLTGYTCLRIWQPEGRFIVAGKQRRQSLQASCIARGARRYCYRNGG